MDGLGEGKIRPIIPSTTYNYSKKQSPSLEAKRFSDS